MTRDSISSQTPTVVNPNPQDVVTHNHGHINTVPSTNKLQAGQVEKAETVAKYDHSQLEYQQGLGLTKEVEDYLASQHAYVWKQDDKGNYLIKSARGDPKNPRSWPNWRRYAVVGLASEFVSSFPHISGGLSVPGWNHFAHLAVVNLWFGHLPSAD